MLDPSQPSPSIKVYSLLNSNYNHGKFSCQNTQTKNYLLKSSNMNSLISSNYGKTKSKKKEPMQNLNIKIFGRSYSEPYILESKQSGGGKEKMNQTSEA